MHNKDVQPLQSIEAAYRRVYDAKVVKTQKGTVGEETISRFTEQMNVGRYSTIGSLTNRKLIRRDQSRYKNSYTKFFDRMKSDYGADSKEIELLQNTWMKSTYGPSTFKSSVNPSKMVDYSVLNPVNMMKLIPNLLSRISIRTPFSKDPIKLSMKNVVPNNIKNGVMNKCFTFISFASK